MSINILENAIGEEGMQKETCHKCSNGGNTVKDLLKEMVEVVKDVQLEKECDIVVDLDAIPKELNMPGMVVKVTDISILDNEIGCIYVNEDGEQENIRFKVNHYMQLVRNFNNRAKKC